jgi:hypothetical protein
MPLPTPSKGEKEQEFVSRCMGSDVMNKEFPEQKQRAAVCYRQFRGKNEEFDEPHSIEGASSVVQHVGKRTKPELMDPAFEEKIKKIFK